MNEDENPNYQLWVAQRDGSLVKEGELRLLREGRFPRADVTEFGGNAPVWVLAPQQILKNLLGGISTNE